MGRRPNGPASRQGSDTRRNENRDAATETLAALGSLVLVLVIVTAAAVWMLQIVLRDLDHVQNHAAVLVEDVGRLGQAITEVEVELYELKLGKARHLDSLIEGVERLRNLVQRLGEHYVIKGEASRPR